MKGWQVGEKKVWEIKTKEENKWYKMGNGKPGVSDGRNGGWVWEYPLSNPSQLKYLKQDFQIRKAQLLGQQ